MLPTLDYVKVKHIMNVANILQNARRALVPMRKATIDALLLTAFIVSFLVFTGVLFSYPWLIVAIYVLTYLLAVVLRLRHAARQMRVEAEKEQSLEEAYKVLSSPRTLADFMGYLYK